MTEPRDSRLQSGEVFWIECTVCGPNGAMDTPRFSSEQALWSSLLLTHEHGWVLRDDGRVLCDVHRRVVECDEHGHVMTPWAEHPLDDELD